VGYGNYAEAGENGLRKRNRRLGVDEERLATTRAAKSCEDKVDSTALNGQQNRFGGELDGCGWNQKPENRVSNRPLAK
jgi:hypothetical protein